jgi:hypothetical protein
MEPPVPAERELFISGFRGPGKWKDLLCHADPWISITEIPFSACPIGMKNMKKRN